MNAPHFTLPMPVSPSHRVAYINARLLDPETGLDTNGALLTEGETIADLGENIFPDGVPDGLEVIDCKGHLLTPGLIDIQVHFREPGQEHKETIETGSKSAVAGGITTVVCQPNTRPAIDDVPIVDFIHKRARERGYCHVKMYGAVSKGLKGENLTEMGLLAEAGVVGFTDDGLPVGQSLLMRRAMEYARLLDLPICQHAEDLSLSNNGCMNEGAISTRLGVNGIPNASEAVCIARDLYLQELTGAHYHVLHVSTAEGVEMVRRAKTNGQRVTCEAAPHHFTLNDEALLSFNTNAKMNPPLRSESDRLAIIEGLKDGTIDAIATDHAPHDVESKDLPLQSASFGIVGLETMLPLSLALYHNGTLSLRDLLAKLTHQPADIIRNPAGRLQKGRPADLTLIDLDQEWTIRNADFASKSQNGPFDGHTVKGRAIRTVVGGTTVYALS